MQKQNAKDKILDAAIKVFAEKGYGGASTREIAEAAGVSEGSVFKYYKTKRGLLLAALDRLTEIFSDSAAVKPYEEMLGENKDAPSAVFTAIAGDRARVIRENLDLIKVIIVESMFDKTICAKFNYAVRTKLFPALHEHVDEGVRTGAFREMGMDGGMSAMRAFISMTAGCVLQRNLLPGLIPMDEEKDLALTVDIFINGISKNPD